MCNNFILFVKGLKSSLQTNLAFMYDLSSVDDMR